MALARRVHPHFPRALTEYVAAAYAELRQEEADAGEGAHSYTTARTLLSVLRLASALARLRFCPEVAQSDVDEALRLMRMSKASLDDDAAKGGGPGGGRGGGGGGRPGGDPVSEIYALLRELAERGGTQEVSYASAVAAIARKAYGADMLDACLDEYCELGVWALDAGRNVTFASD